MSTLFIGVLAGIGLGLLTWYGWAIVENVGAMLARRRSNAEAAQDAGEPD